MYTGGKSVLACASLFLALAAQTSGHAIPSPALGVSGAPARSDVQRPSAAKPCGTIDIASTIDTSTAIPAAADGSVTMNVENFNAGADGSTSVAVTVDATGKGTAGAFKAATVQTNGNPAPSKVETDKVTFTLPAGTKCTGGTAGNLCLVSVKTTAGFGACTVVSQGAAAVGAAAPADNAGAGSAAAAGTATAAADTTAAVADTTVAVADTTAAAVTATDAAAATATAAAGTAGNTTTTGAGKKHHHHKAKGGAAAQAGAAAKAGKAGAAGKAKAAAAGGAAAAAAPAAAAPAAAGGAAAAAGDAAAPAGAAAAAPAAAKAGTRAARALRRELMERRGA